MKIDGWNGIQRKWEKISKDREGKRKGEIEK